MEQRFRYTTSISTIDAQRWNMMQPSMNLRVNTNQPINDNDFPSLSCMIDYVHTQLDTVPTIEYMEAYVHNEIEQVQGANRVVNEVPNGVINNSNAVFTTDLPFDPDTIEVMVNGITLSKPDEYYTVGNYTIYLSQSLLLGDKILVNYTDFTNNI